MTSQIAIAPRPYAMRDVWPPDDTKESVVGTDWHQTTILNLRLGINEVARLLTAPDQEAPWHAFSQTIIRGFARADRSRYPRYKTLPDVFVYRQPIDRYRGSLAVGSDGPPILIIEVLSESTYDVDLDIERGKGYSYAHAGVREYLALDPTRAFVPAGGRGWRLVDGVYQPWATDAAGRWCSNEIAVAIGLEGMLATVYTHDGRRQLREGEVTSEVERLRMEVERLRRLLDDH